MPTKPSIQIRILDSKMQAYLQGHPFAEGPDSTMNEAARQAILAGLEFRPVAPDYPPKLIAASETKLPEEDEARLDQLLSAMQIAPDQASAYKNDFGWETNLVPRNKKNILVIGCGDGIELIFLRAMLPGARITGIDYRNSLLPRMQENVGLELLVGDMNMHLKSLTREYDLIFSNHTLEHLYTPDEVLSLLASLLISGGHLVSTLPMVAKEGMPFLDKVRAAVANRFAHPLDMVFLDAGHPWKTNPSDIKQTMELAGFKNVEVYQRENHISRPLGLSPEEYVKFRKSQMLYYSLFVAPIRGILKLLFPKNVPPKLPRLLFAFERRISWGPSRLMSLFSEEALVMAEASS